MKKIIIFIMIAMFLVVLVSCNENNIQEPNINVGVDKPEIENISVVKCNHSYYEWCIVKYSTCCENGYDEARCTQCGEVFLTHISDLTEHIYIWRTVKERTCTEDGLRVEMCVECGHESGSYEITESLGHLDYVSTLYPANSDVYYVRHYCGRWCCQKIIDTEVFNR